MQEQISESSGITLMRSMQSDDFCEIYRGCDPDNGSIVRVVAFTSAAYSDPRVREAYKSDRTRLYHFRHSSIARYLRDVEFEDRLCFLQESRDWPALAESPRRGKMTTDDVVEIGWQICSGLQTAHNTGIFHGAIRENSVLLSDDLRVLLCDFRLEHWRHAAAAVSEREAEPSDGELTSSLDSISIATATDLRQLLELLMQLVTESEERCNDGGEQIGDEEDSARRAALRQLLESLLRITPEDWSYTARDVQGMLGEILIGDGQDAMAVVDRRIAESRFRTSIVEELFDDTSVVPSETDESGQAARAIKPLILPILLGAAITVLLLWAAGLLG